ncbi:hypothetical protein [Leptospira ilyithenensis]|uniref:Uncharacterized protein n=1 Tax=Leptospira ilyithenensis TaxID=2484901 RepID=A0A4R9LJF8_9LEPT|nr:hypothetical protein [Leptospira ilyithenensis]TGN06963.1 hypothetical protein EHS11_17690 [Leptospira ilyithenensis]
MKVSTIVPVSLCFFSILSANYYLFSSTKSNIDRYHNFPPFRIEDATKSGGLGNLLDNDSETVWIKKLPSSADWDFFLEMKLSHFWDGVVFSPRNFTSLGWKACKGQTLPPFEAKLLLRESINVDKELRMPNDKLITVYRFGKENETKTEFPIQKYLNLKSEKNYPSGISILTVEVKLMDVDSTNNCFSEIILSEK